MKRKLLTGAAAAGFAVAMAVVYLFPPAEHSFYPRCPFYTVTHLLCPGCGSTRALHALLHGDFNTAMHYNAMFTLLAPFLLGWAVFCCWHLLRYDRFPRFRVPRAAMAALGVAVLLFTVGRNTLFHF